MSLAIASACDMGTDCCMEGAASAVSEGFVLRAEAPLPNAVIWAIGNRYTCESPSDATGLVDGLATSDDDGWFRLHLSSFLGSDGTSCFDVVVSTPSPQTTDTVRGIKAPFFVSGVADTARVLIRSDP